MFRSPPRLVLLDAQSGFARSKVETCGDADDVFFDPVHKRIYVSCGQGAIDVFDQTQGTLQRLARIVTSPGARRPRCSSPELDRLYVAARSWGGGAAKILIYRAQP